jgi:hypothetical protein
MKYIKTINELNKSTYLSAAKKLKDLGGSHKKRAEKLLKHSDKFGTESDVHNLHYHVFKINYMGVNGKYKITGSNINGGCLGQDSCTVDIYVDMENENGEKKKIGVEIYKYGPDGWATRGTDVANVEYEEMYIYFCEGDEIVDSIGGFKFGSRADAIEFKKFILDEYSDNQEFRRELDCFSKVSINKLWE